MAHLLRGLILTLIVGLSACSTTRVILVPDPEGKVGQVDVRTDSGQQTLTKARQSVTAGQFFAPSKPEILTQEQIDQRFGQTLKSEPQQPATFILQFRLNSAELTAESATLIPKAVEQIRQRNSCYIVAAGHTDAIGDRDYNIQLSLQRANRVKTLLTQQDIDANCIEILSYGENDPLIPTADNVAEPRNRRVELVIR